MDWLWKRREACSEAKGGGSKSEGIADNGVVTQKLSTANSTGKTKQKKNETQCVYIRTHSRNQGVWTRR